MSRYKRIVTIVIDSPGVGALPDAAAYGDAGTVCWKSFWTIPRHSTATARSGGICTVRWAGRVLQRCHSRMRLRGMWTT